MNSIRFLRKTLRTKGRPERETIWVKILGYLPSTRKKPGLEFRANGCHCVIRAIHPETGQPYQIVHGATPIEIHYADIVWPAGFTKNSTGSGEVETKDYSWAKNYPGILFEEFDLVACLRSIGITVRQDKADSGRFFIPCLWREQHKDQGGQDKERDAAILQNQGAWSEYVCFHTHCETRHLGSVLDWVKVKKPSIDLKRFCTRGREEQTLSSVPWPTMAPQAYHGLLGRIIKAIEPESEADPTAMLIQTLVAFGNKLGRSPHFWVEGTQHHTNLFCCTVGKSSRSRKGTAWDRARYVFSRNPIMPTLQPPDWRITGGLSTGEGVISAVRDAVLKTAAVIRQSWDHGNLSAMTKDSYKATDAHISIVGQITAEELKAKLKATDQVNGFANRFLWICARRSKILPEGGKTHIAEVTEAIEELARALSYAGSAAEMSRSEEARALWREVYPQLTSEASGIVAAITSRGDAQVLRLSMIYALADRSAVIEVEHLRAALAVWQYCEDSVKYLFGKTIDDKQLVKLYRALRVAPDGLTQNEILKNVFRKNLTSKEIGKLLEVLEKAGHIFCRTRARKDGKGGKPATIWFATDKG
jgi:hypothetical protein